MMSASERIAPERLSELLHQFKASFYDDSPPGTPGATGAVTGNYFADNPSQRIHSRLMRINGDRLLRMPHCTRGSFHRNTRASRCRLAEGTRVVVAEVRAAINAQGFLLLPSFFDRN